MGGAILGAVIGFLYGKFPQLLTYVLAGAATGLILFLLVGFRSGLVFDDPITGAINGAIIAFLLTKIKV